MFEKLTMWTQYGYQIKGFSPITYDLDIHECKVLGDAAARLAAYEDTGLTPDEITDMIYRFEAFLSAMTGNRMSKLNYTLEAMILAANDYRQSLCDECWDRSELAKYYELEHEKRLVVLPCKVGDIVWFTLSGRIDYGYVKWFETDKNGIWIVAVVNPPKGPMFFEFNDFGKTIFITREEAEKVLGEV